ncbi:hypothetical protein HOLleu_25547 [Holothuria leucospilota]|uniref:Uncharacterized protein n=1 Tax=Holothuria leucospilota TaxID=206669 RepID=A0A9Q1BT67_HOLLE|nr:hypothetical protein HOLleu_25547 [Holothuria leucospilota]
MVSKYEDMKLRVADHLTEEVVSELSTRAGFSSDKRDKIKDGTSFLKELESQCNNEMTFCGTLRVLLENHDLHKEANIVKEYSKERVSGKCRRAQIPKGGKLAGYLKRTPKAAKLAFEQFKGGIHQGDNPTDDTNGQNKEPDEDQRAESLNKQFTSHRKTHDSPERFISFNFKTNPK